MQRFLLGLVTFFASFLWGSALTFTRQASSKLSLRWLEVFLVIFFKAIWYVGFCSSAWHQGLELLCRLALHCTGDLFNDIAVQRSSLFALQSFEHNLTQAPLLAFSAKSLLKYDLKSNFSSLVAVAANAKALVSSAVWFLVPEWLCVMLSGLSVLHC